MRSKHVGPNCFRMRSYNIDCISKPARRHRISRAKYFKLLYEKHMLGIQLLLAIYFAEIALLTIWMHFNLNAPF